MVNVCGLEGVLHIAKSKRKTLSTKGKRTSYLQRRGKSLQAFHTVAVIQTPLLRWLRQITPRASSARESS